MSERIGERVVNNFNGGKIGHHLPFSIELRVLLIDQDPVCLRTLVDLLTSFNYQVTPKCNGAEAVFQLKNDEKFDIVLTDADMDGFKVLEAGVEKDIPVVMMSANESIENMMKAIEHGAREFLLKPLMEKEIKHIWQHVYRNKPSLCPCVKLEGDALTNEDRKRKVRNDDSGSGSGSSSNDKVLLLVQENAGKRERVRWTETLQEKFESAVESLGGAEKAVPKKILSKIGIHGITRAQVASHLQKFRKSTTKKTKLNRSYKGAGTGTEVGPGPTTTYLGNGNGIQIINTNFNCWIQREPYPPQTFQPMKPKNNDPQTMMMVPKESHARTMQQIIESTTTTLEQIKANNNMGEGYNGVMKYDHPQTSIVNPAPLDNCPPNHGLLGDDVEGVFSELAELAYLDIMPHH